MDINWHAVTAAAFTAIRIEFPVQVLQRMAAEGNETPVSGDALTLRLADMSRLS